MVKFTSFVSIAALLGASSVSANGLYGRSSPVLQIDAKSYEKLIAQSNHPSVVEFYAPWCGHCQNFKLGYEKTAKALDGLAQVAAVNCDDDKNKPFCNQMGIRGFPTLKIVVPSTKPGKPIVDEYRGKRGVRDIKRAVIDRIPNHVKRVTDKDLDSWLAEANSTAKAILFSKKGTTSGILRSLAIDFLGSIEVAQVRNKEKATVSMFGIKSFPTFVLLPGGDKELLIYQGAMEKKPMLEFLSQVASPNPDVAPQKKKSRNASKATSEASTPSATQTTPSSAERITEMPTISDNDQFQKTCLEKGSKLCILALINSSPDGGSRDIDPSFGAERALWETVQKQITRGGSSTPFYTVSTGLDGAKLLIDKLGLNKEASTNLLAINTKRGWWYRYEPAEESEDAYQKNDLEAWVDQIKMGEGEKRQLPEGIACETAEGGSPSNEENGHNEL
ncbi:hypothetical protein KEM56_005649 [Ascosphaera pollenicola]|nr:hypothetical protein KEM56_005649 [Ascosphaera pollenicola]